MFYCLWRVLFVSFKQNVIHLIVCHLAVYVSKQGVWVAQCFVPSVFKVDFDDMILIYTIVNEVIVKQLEQ